MTTPAAASLLPLPPDSGSGIGWSGMDMRAYAAACVAHALAGLNPRAAAIEVAAQAVADAGALLATHYPARIGDLRKALAMPCGERAIAGQTKSLLSKLHRDAVEDVEKCTDFKDAIMQAAVVKWLANKVGQS